MNESAEAPKSGCLKLASSMWSIGIAAIIILFMAAIAGPKLIESRLPSNETTTIGMLRFIHSAQRLYRDQGHARYANMDELQREAMKGGQLEKGVKQGYRFASQPAKSQPGSAWWATAEPVEPGRTGLRYFAINHKGAIYYSLAGPVIPNPDTGEISATDKVKLLGSQ